MSESDEKGIEKIKPKGNVEGKFQGPIERKTRAQLIEMLEAMGDQLDSVQDMLQDRDKELAAVRTAPHDALHEGGWLVTTLNPTYEGSTLGVPFHGGRAFVSRRQKNGEWIVKEMEDDFGYQVEELTGKQVLAMREQSEDMELEVSLQTAKQLPKRPFDVAPTVLTE